MDFLFGKTFPADAPGGEEKAKTCQLRLVPGLASSLWHSYTQRHLFLGP